MKTTLAVSLLALAATEVAAFPRMAAEQAARLEASPRGKRSTLARSPHKKRVSFDPKSQYVSTTGDHAFVPPNFNGGDVRGPCPGLNAAANHGYIPHSVLLPKAPGPVRFLSRRCPASARAFQRTIANLLTRWLSRWRRYN